MEILGIVLEVVLIIVAVLAAPILFTLIALEWFRLRDRLFGPPKRRRVTPEEVTAARRARGRMRRMAAPTLLLTPTKAPGFSKLGGDPELPAGVAWPEGEAAPRAFLAQIDLAEVRANGGPDWLPETGRLYAFHDDQRYGFADPVTILHSLEPAGPPVAPPVRLSAKQRYPERRVGFLAFTSFPSVEWLGLDSTELDEDALEGWDDTADATFGDELQHRIGGYPGEIQQEEMPLSCERLARGLPAWSHGEETPPAIARAAKSWRLLLQIDSDPDLKMKWGDTGRLYVFVREKHARAADFSRTVALWQTY